MEEFPVIKSIGDVIQLFNVQVDMFNGTTQLKANQKRLCYKLFRDPTEKFLRNISLVPENNQNPTLLQKCKSTNKLSQVCSCSLNDFKLISDKRIQTLLAWKKYFFAQHSFSPLYPQITLAALMELQMQQKSSENVSKHVENQGSRSSYDIVCLFIGFYSEQGLLVDIASRMLNESEWSPSSTATIGVRQMLVWDGTLDPSTEPKTAFVPPAQIDSLPSSLPLIVDRRRCMSLSIAASALHCGPSVCSDASIAPNTWLRIRNLQLYPNPAASSGGCIATIHEDTHINAVQPYFKDVALLLGPAPVAPQRLLASPLGHQYVNAATCLSTPAPARLLLRARIDGYWPSSANNFPHACPDGKKRLMFAVRVTDLSATVDIIAYDQEAVRFLWGESSVQELHDAQTRLDAAVRSGAVQELAVVLYTTKEGAIESKRMSLFNSVLT